MFGKIIGAIAGERAARHVSGVNGPMGAALGAGAVALARRFGPLGIVAVAAGGYALKRYREKQDRQHGEKAPAHPL
ncbi:MAG: hypothetical protein WCY92_13060 [Novosphingobium sp.]|uniref:hypothetical protein n=1 Tax=Tsuneonella sp. CC-YZS046 TaxID=3042152 RepID=UPI002D77704E|nr:hypothetical protein [Tsuneonella sp. CC-YZS046]WRO65176.1 hypothetical protein U8326_08800 [Tsuneonella sp. CC-YZS046]